MKPDLFDVIIFIGLIIVIAGIAMMSIPVACIIGGLGLMLCGVICSLRKADLRKQAEKKKGEAE